MYRNFPCADRRTLKVLLVAFSALLCAGLIPAGLVSAAATDELEDRKHAVETEINRAERHLDQSSDRLLSTARTLDAAKARLGSARDLLERSRGRFAAAEVLDRQMQAQLDTAIARLQKARVDLARGRVDLATQEEVLGQLAVQNYQAGDPSLLGLSMVLTSQRPSDLTSQLNSVRSVLDKEAMTLDRLDASRVVLTLQERELDEAEADVAVQRESAAENLERKAVLESQAQRAAAQVAQMVAERAAARDAAAEAKAIDLRQLRERERERDRISAMLERRAEAARKRAEARAKAEAARAEAQALAQARATAEAARNRARANATAQAARNRARSHANEEAARNRARSHANAEAAQGQVDARSSPSALEPDGLLSYPVDSYVTSNYGMRLHPVYKRWALHDGTDFGAACGTPIRAAADGTVVGAYYNSAYGNRVLLDHGYQAGAGLATAYNHMSNYSVDVGQRVERGDIVGYVGSTGYSTGCHLHFMVFRDGATVDPMDWL